MTVDPPHPPVASSHPLPRVDRGASADRVLRVAAIRQVESTLLAAAPDGALMERAGRAVAAAAMDVASERGGPFVLLAGPGNNGGDALVAARVLHGRGVDVRIARLSDPAAYRGDAALAWQRWTDAAGPAAAVHDVSHDPTAAIASASVVVDGLFGIGASRPPAGVARDWIERANAAGCPVVAIDVPSGVDADTGHVADVAIAADVTVTMIARKPGLETGDGLEAAGRIVVDALGSDDLPLPPFARGDVGAINGPARFAAHWPRRRRNSHKGTFGSVAVVGGHDGMVGAALLASRMALHSGAGRVYVRLLAADGPTVDLRQPELMLRTSLDGVDVGAWAIGPGLGGDDAGREALRTAIDGDAPLVVDADGLNAIARDPSLVRRLVARSGRRAPPAVLTPHPLEAARLLAAGGKADTAAVQRDRLSAALRLAHDTGSVVVLKGAGSIVAAADGSWVINRTGNPTLATGGTGDVLCGLVAGLLAQGMPPIDAARAATWLHGTAADDLVAVGTGPAGVTASELIVAIRSAINRVGTAAH